MYILVMGIMMFSDLDSDVPVLVYKVSHVIPVDVYDTTGADDVHLNREIVAQLEEST